MHHDSTSGAIPTPIGPLRWLLWREQSTAPTEDTPPAWLHPDEIAVWRALRTTKRRDEWQRGRRAAKQLVAELVRGQTGHALLPGQVAVLPHADGWPVVRLPASAGVPGVTLSISHSGKWAFCAAVVGEGQPLGADVESIEPRTAAFAEAYFTPLEREFLSAGPAEQRDALINAVWSGKEAALKAIRRGLAEDTWLVSCLPHPEMAGGAAWLPLRITWDEARGGRSLPPLAGRWRRVNDVVLTLAFAA